MVGHHSPVRESVRVDHPAARRRDRLAVATAAVLGAVAVVTGWALSSPAGSVPDEGAHAVYAWGVATGQVGPGRDVVELRAVPEEPEVTALYLTLEVPPDLGAIAREDCYRFDWRVPAGCEPPQPGALADTYMVRYPPVAYLPVGAALRLQVAAGAPVDVAFAGARVGAGLLALALLVPSTMLLARRFGAAPVTAALLVGLTPMAVYLISSVNPSGLEVAAAVAVASLVCVVRRDVVADGVVRLGPQALLVVAVVVLAWTRPISWLWAGLLLALLLVPAPADGRRWWRRAPAWRLSPVVLGLVVVAVLGAMAWAVYAAGLRLGAVPYEEAWDALPLWSRVLLVVLKTGDLLTQSVGLLGWLDTPLPAVHLLAWTAGAAALVAAAVRGRGSTVLGARWVLAFLLTAWVLVAAHSLWAAYGYQGRYVLPVLAAACVLLVPSLTAMRPDTFVRWRGLLVLAGVVALQVLAVAWHTWRYAYGARQDNPRLPAAPLPVGDLAWSPLPGQEVVLVLTTAGLLALAAAVVLAGRLDLRGTADRAEATA